jgi:hypothetical protein
VAPAAEVLGGGTVVFKTLQRLAISKRADKRLTDGSRCAAILVIVVVITLGSALGAELLPPRIEEPLGKAGPRIGLFSARTLVVGVEFDRDEAELVAYTVKPRPYARTMATDTPRAHDETSTVQLEVVLSGAGGLRHTRRIDVGPLCLVHGGEAAPHVTGDVIRVHRDSVVVELPEIAGFDRIEVAYYERHRGSTARRSLGTSRLDRGRFTPAGGSLEFSDLVHPDSSGGEPPLAPSGAQPLWPEDFGDTDLYHVFGDAAEGNKRINVVIVPDGYTYAEKAGMETHANAMVSHFRAKTPYAEHDPFINYTLVYAYSAESGTDQCDCDIVQNTMMGTRFLESNPQCGHSDNRCLYYGGGCDTNGTNNIIAAELRAPYHDETIVMVNTTRYGGCGGARAVYSAALPSAKEIAVHELGHSLGGLADEYSYDPGCGGYAGEVNTSTNALHGAWPEWIEDLGAPREGAQYYQECLFRPFDGCEMRSLNQPFCAVCVQHWSLVTFGHPRVAPTAPIESQTPEPATSTWTGIPTDFSVSTRLSSGAAVSNLFIWTLRAPGQPSPVVIATGTDSVTQVFEQPGDYVLELMVIADANFVKRAKDGTNVDVVTWEISVSPLAPPPEVSPPGSAEPLRFLDRKTLTWEDASGAAAFAYNLYRGNQTDFAFGDYGACLQSGIEQNSTVESDSPPEGVGWFYLIAGVNPAGEGPLGQASSGDPRTSVTPCD